MAKETYHPETYWSEVSKRISSREQKHGKIIAGDDEPYYRYKRKQFMKLLSKVSFEGKSVLEIGFGPGGNLEEVYKRRPKKLAGADISQNMVDLARKRLPEDVSLTKINGTELPFEDDTFDIVFTATVLQHNTDEAMLKQIIGEICRVSGSHVYLFERIESTIFGDELCLGRPVDYYAAFMKEHGFELESTEFINVRVSYYVSGAMRKLLNPKSREEGQPLSGISVLMQKITLPVTAVLDRIFSSKKDVARMAFTKKK